MKTFEGHTSSVLRAIFITKGMQIASRCVCVGGGWACLVVLRDGLVILYNAHRTVAVMDW